MNSESRLHLAPSQVPTVSVVITNYNYGHFLPACLTSLRSQSVAPDEIILVDDGSVDGSQKILARLKDVQVIKQKNGGQAAAFNTGFAASTGDAVLFLDSDDQLNPNAIEVIKRFWCAEISALSFHLDTIDAAGRNTGHYPMHIPDTDLLARLLGDLTIPFMPTSGNVFRRAAIQWIFPLPAQKWRISADALLIRAAVFTAPLRHIPQTLGQYRIHGNNNYFKIGSERLWANNRGMLHIAQAGLDLIDLAAKSKLGLKRRDRLKLLVAALRTRLKSDAIQRDPRGLVEFFGDLMQRSPPGASLRFFLLLALIRLPAMRSAVVRRWICDAGQRPRGVQSLLNLALGADLRRDLYAFIPSRNPFDCAYSLEGPALLDPRDALSGPEWVRNYETGGVDLRHPIGSMIFRRACNSAVKVILQISSPTDRDVQVLITHNDQPVGRFTARKPAEISFKLPPSATFAPQKDHIKFQVSEVARTNNGLLQRLKRSAIHLKLISATLSPERAELTDGVIPVSDQIAFSRLGDVIRSAHGKPLIGETIIGSGEKLSLAKPALASPFSILFSMSGDQVSGSVVITTQGITIFDGQVCANGTIRMEIPQSVGLGLNPIELAFGFRPDDFLDGDGFQIDQIGWLPGTTDGRYHQPQLSPGEWVRSGSGKGLKPYLGDGWEIQPDGEAEMFGTLAELIISQGSFWDGARLEIDIEPQEPLAINHQVILAITVNGQHQTTVHLAGRALIEIPIDQALALPGHEIEIGLHAAGRLDDTDVTVDHGGLRLWGIGLSAKTSVTNILPMTPTLPESAPVIMTLLRKLDGALAGKINAPKLHDLRMQLIEAIKDIAPSALPGLLSANDLHLIAAMSAKLPALGPQIALERPENNPDEWLVCIALAMASGPAFKTSPQIALNKLPECSPDYARVIGAFLVADPARQTTRSDLKIYQNHLVELLEDARKIIATHPVHSPYGIMADAMVTKLRARTLLFSDLNLLPHVSAFSKALEAKLLRAGHNLHLSGQVNRTSTPRSKQRLGILMHHTDPAPETWIMRSIASSLAGENIEIILFLTERTTASAEGFGVSQVVGMAGQSVAGMVAEIRHADLDIMLLGANFYGYSLIGQVAAHRLAPQQIAMSAIFPTTTGLSSVDEFILGQSVTPKRAHGDYSETVIIAPGTGQTFDLPPSDMNNAETAEQLRQRLGVGPKNIMLTSGAALEKIGPEILNLWMGILADAPQAVLVLYPFAENWQQNFDTVAFEERLNTACTQATVERDRIKVLPPISNSEVGQILSATDVYLDSFPYSGATTTVEALSRGVPVVARQGRTQRGHQAAGWLSAFGLRELIARSGKDYVNIAVKLAKNANQRRDISQKLAKIPSDILFQNEFALWFRNYIFGKNANVSGPPRYLFHHLPKTGGTSVTRIMREWFKIVPDYREPWASTIPARLELEKIGPEELICGHFAADTMPLNARYPETMNDPLWRRISFVRDPLSIVLSSHAHEKKQRPQHDPTFISKPLGEILRNSHGVFLHHFECTEENWREVLDQYWFIGTLERLPECMNYLARQMGKPVPDIIPIANVTPRDEIPDPEDVAIFKRNNAVEFEIYDEISARLDRRLKEQTFDQITR